MANPTAREQELLELVNRMRTAPAAELALLLNSSDPEIASALTYFKVDRNLLATQWSALTAAAPLAWSSQLNDVAVTHNQKMIQYDQQSHQVGVYDSSGNLITAYEPGIAGRISAANYNFTYGGENIFAYGRSTLEAQAALAIDWGDSPATGGIQNPAGHRDNIMSSNFREIGIGATEETNPSTEVGPLVLTQSFGNRSALNGKAWLLGVAFQDTNKDGWYGANEGLQDVSVKITGINGTVFAATVVNVTSSGGYQNLLNPGQYQVDFLRNGAVISTKTTLINADNVKVDLVVPAVPVVPVLTRNDFNGDGKSDLLWRNDNGNIALWQMNGATVTTSSLTSTATLPSSWKTAGTGDFTGDGKADILWRNDNGTVALWQMNGSTVTTSTIVAPVSADWKIAGNGDFNGDGKADILWRNDNGTVALWQMNGAAVTASSLTSTAALNNSWKIAGNGDFNGDGKADILWRNDDGTVALWQMNGSTVNNSSIVASVSADWKIAGNGDFNGDGKADILWRNDNGNVALWQMNGATVTASSLTSTPALDNNWKIASIGDFNGDSKADIFWRNDNAGAVWTMNGSTVAASTLTSATADGSWKTAAPMI